MPVFYQSEAVKIRPTGDLSAAVTVPILQSVGVSFNVQRNDITRLGKFAPMPYRQANQWPTINLQVDFIPTGNDVETVLGLMHPSSAIQYLVTPNAYKWSDVVIQINETCYDGDGQTKATMTLSDAVLTNYSFQASVGQTPRASFAMEALDLGIGTGSFTVTSQNDMSPVIRPQDIELVLPTGIFGVYPSGMYVQNVSLNLALPRNSLQKIGSQKPFSRELQAPVMATVQLSAIMSRFDDTTATENSDEMKSLVCGKFLDETMIIKIWQPVCTGTPSSQAINFVLKRPYIDSFNMSNSVGGYTSVELNMTIPVSPTGVEFGQSDLESNLIFSGNNTGWAYGL